MALTNFVSSVWSETLFSQMNKKYIAVSNCNRDFDGDIKGKGDRVKICGVGDIAVFDYTKNTDFSSDAQQLSNTEKTLIIDQAKAFNFVIDDIDRAQSNPKLMDAAVKNAAAALANTADKYIFETCALLAETLISETVNEDNIISVLIDAQTMLLKNNVSDPADIVIEVTPDVGALILKNKISISKDDTALESGCIGKIAGCKVYVSNNVSKSGKTHRCLARSKRAMAFAEQLSEIDAYRPEKRFGDAVKGLHLYGSQLLYPNELIRLDLALEKDLL
ncbi:MAG: hypothetical protein ACI3XI_03820 [Eubacteriales bacterium]